MGDSVDCDYCVDGWHATGTSTAGGEVVPVACARCPSGSTTARGEGG